MLHTAYSFGFQKLALGLTLFASGLSVATAQTHTAFPLTGNPLKDAEFGRSIAIDGERVVIGGAEGSDAAAIGPGTVYVYRRIGTSYVQEAKLVAPDRELGAEFGRAVAVKGDVIVVGARFASNATSERAGAAYIFRRKTGVWTFEQKIEASDSSPEDNFGRAVALDDDVVVVTARKEDVSVDNDGAAYVFRKRGAGWVEEAKLTARDSSDEARFGQSVAVRGKLLIVGARDANTPIADGAGTIYLFTRHDKQWTEAAKASASDGATGDQFAYNVAIGGNLIAVGARRADLPGARDAGAAYVYKLAEGQLIEIAKLTASDARQGDEFGHSIAMSGRIIAVGARRADIDGKRDQGTVYIFRRSRNQWSEVAKLTAPDGQAGAEFAHSLAADDGKIAVGANLADIHEANQGAAYVYDMEE